MAMIRQRGKSWNAQVRCCGVYVSNTFGTEAAAREWATNARNLIQQKRERQAISMPLTRGSFAGAVILEHDEIVARSVPVSQLCGIYFLISGGVVDYIGKSVDVYNRVSEHKMKGRSFDAFHVVPCAPEQLNMLESMYIYKLRPKGNHNKRGLLVLSVPQEKIHSILSTPDRRLAEMLNVIS